MSETTLRPYDPNAEADRRTLWELKTAFETELGEMADNEPKAATYGAKLTDRYRSRWLSWVDRCIEDDKRCLLFAVEDCGAVGYIFLLPERLAFIWDSAVVNELYVVETRRGDGVADALLGRAIEIAAEQELPLDRLLLDVSHDNSRARRFYERHGFKPWGEIVAKDL
ncbi:MAG: N-acetyltransferase family protein [Halobacteriota archaeon]|uniref:GNAT family N-acetyltransferase n=1 Tax=Natronomonas sp. TaxID=2184060 RepID=UPI0039770F76